MVRIAVLFAVFAASASATQPPKIKQGRTSVSIPRSYCLANVASLGTGLMRASALSGSRFPPQKRNRWTGWIRASASGNYEFSLPGIDGQIFLNRQRVFPPLATSSKSSAVQVDLVTNRFYAISVEIPKSEDSTLPLHWRRPDGRVEPVPKVYLYAPLATAGDGETKNSKLH